MTNFNPVLYPTLNLVSVIIPSGNTVSNAIDLADLNMVGLILPVALTSTAMTFNVSPDNINFYHYYNTAGTQVSITVQPNTYVGFTPGDFAGIRYLALVGGTAEGADRTIEIVTRTLM